VSAPENGRVYPNWGTIRRLPNQLTEGEIALLRFLDENLPKEWLLFAQPFVNGTRPDIVAFRPGIGAMIYEVKDWRLSAYSWHRTTKGLTLHVSDARGTYLVKNPVRQVAHYKEKIIGLLVPGIGEKIDDNAHAFGVIKTGVYFHRETTDAAKRFFFLAGKESVPVIGHDALVSGKIKLVVPDVGLSRSKYWDESWDNELLFWLRPPRHVAEQAEPLKLSEEQTKHATPAPGHHRLRGAAGSGKTLVLAYRAARLASEGKRVLILTYNITLWHYIHDAIRRAPFVFDWERITAVHFHGFCKDILNHFGVHWPEGEKEEVFQREVVAAVLKAIEGKQHELWDAVLIDEGQDYCVEWYRMLRHFLTDREEVLLVCDAMQNIYGRDNSWTDRPMKDVAFRGPWGELRRSYRLPNEVAVLARRFGELFGLDQRTRVEDAQTELEFRPHVVWCEIEDRRLEEWLWRAFTRLKKEGEHASDMVFLLPNHEIGMRCARHFEKQGISVNHVFEIDGPRSTKRHKVAFWNQDSRLKMCTVHSFKGWECANVVLYIGASPQSESRRNDMLVYTAITRTRGNLIVLNANTRYREFGESLPCRWE